MTEKKKVGKEKKKPLTKQARSEIANKAVAARRENNPNWGAGARKKEADKKKKLEDQGKKWMAAS